MENLVGGANVQLKDANEYDAGGGCTGANVIGCFTDVYSNHGWGVCSCKHNNCIYSTNGCCIYFSLCSKKPLLISCYKTLT